MTASSLYVGIRAKAPQCDLGTIFTICCDQRSYTRWLYKRVYKTEMKFWAVLGSRGRKKRLSTAISMQLFGVFFLMFSRSKNNFKFFLKIP